MDTGSQSQAITPQTIAAPPLLIAVDGVESKACQENLYQSKLVFDGPSTLHLLGIRDGKVARIKVSIKRNDGLIDVASRPVPRA